MKKYKIIYKCNSCKHQFNRISASIPKKDPPCPKCKSKKKIKENGIITSDSHPNHFTENGNIDAMIASGKAPGVGGSNIGKAVDLTADIVMKDYGLTDLKDKMKPGETMAPKLAPTQQAMAETMFGKKDNKMMSVFNIGNGPSIVKVPRNMGMNTAAMGQAALGGAYKDEGNPVGRIHAAKYWPKTDFINK